jgi:hypothetical protein
MDCGEQSLCYILVFWQPINIQVWEGLKANFQYFGEYGIILYGNSYVLTYKLLVASSTITIWTSWLQGTVIGFLIWVIVFYFPPIL